MQRMKGSKYYNGKQIQTRRRPFCTAKPDADLCVRMDLPLDKKLWKIRTGPPGHCRPLGHGGPLGLRAEAGRGGPWQATGRWIMGLLLAKPSQQNCVIFSCVLLTVT